MIRKSLLGIAILAATAALAQSDTKAPAAGSMTECAMGAQQKAAAKADAKRMSHEAMAGCPMHDQHMAAAKGESKAMSHEAMMAGCPMHDQHMAAATGESKPMSHEGMMSDCPMHDQHMAADASSPHGDAAHSAAVDHRHDTFGMSHTATRHTFRLLSDGGAIELRSNDAADSVTVDAIRKHLTEVAAQFNAADFSTPGFVHGTAPAGVAEMARLGNAIAYAFEPLPEGGRIAIRTSDPQGVAAVHDFLKFQIVEHRTGDPLTVE